jgi:protein TonB
MASARPIAVLAALWLTAAAAPQSDADLPILVPSMPDWKLAHKVEPEYPALALERLVQGTVRLIVLIGKDGRPEQLRLIRGHPLLAAAAFDAIKQWRYSPTFRGGKPVRVMTHVEVPFWLGPDGKPTREKAEESERFL